MDEQRLYEMVVIFDAGLEEEALEEKLRILEGSITGTGGTVEEVTRWGKRRLAYPIKKKESGTYVILLFKAAPDSLGEIERGIKLDEQVLRHLVVLKERVSEGKSRGVTFTKKKKFLSGLSDVKEIDYKDEKFLARFLTERGKIVPRRTSGLSAKSQRQLSRAIKRARFLAILPYVGEVRRPGEGRRY